jgi:hypothetical protein
LCPSEKEPGMVFQHVPSQNILANKQKNKQTHSLTPWSTVLLEKMIVPQLEGSGTPFQVVSFLETTSGIAFQCVPSKKYP